MRWFSIRLGAASFSSIVTACDVLGVRERTAAHDTALTHRESRLVCALLAHLRIRLETSITIRDGIRRYGQLYGSGQLPT